MRRIFPCILFTVSVPLWAGVADDPEVKGAERLFQSWSLHLCNSPLTPQRYQWL
jgi:hypothetical protein